MKWNTSVEFQIVALQAVMADLSQGDTIHHAFNIPVFGKNVSTRPVPRGSNKDIENAKAVLQYRWLMIDEISMVSAKLLAEVDMKLRTIMSDIGTLKKGQRGHTRAFGGCLLYTSPSPRD